VYLTGVWVSVEESEESNLESCVCLTGVWVSVDESEESNLGSCVFDRCVCVCQWKRVTWGRVYL
jgi:hypothetical protein